MIHLVPIAQSEINWELLINEANQSLGRNLFDGLNQRWIAPTKSIGDLLSILKEIDNPGSEPFGPAGALLSHAHVSFILVSTTAAMIQIVTKSRLHFTVTPCNIEGFSFAIVSGTLHEWRSAMLNCCDQNSNLSIEVRRFGTKALNSFEEAKLAQYMGLTKVLVSDGTVNLLERK